MRSRWIGWASVLASMLAPAPPSQARGLELPCGYDAVHDVPAPGVSIEFGAEAVDVGIISIMESGQDLDVRFGDEPAEAELKVPPRLGSFSAHVHGRRSITVRRLRPGSAAGRFEIRFDCSPSAEKERETDWLTQLSVIERAREGQSASDAVRDRIPELRALAAKARLPNELALALHEIAQTYSQAERSSDASAAFEAALAAWRKAGERDRGLAALVASAEDLQRTAAYQAVLNLTRTPDGGRDRSRYFSVRLQNSRCLALQYLARRDESAACYQWTTTALEGLGETLELISTLQDYAQLRRDQGNLDLALWLARRALSLISGPEWDSAPGPGVPIVRGRVHRLLSELAARQGDVTAALSHSSDALEFFGQAKSARWEANTFIRAAELYADLGALDDARANVATALGRLDPKDAPARVASAQLVRADLEFEAGDLDEAERWARSARETFERLGMSDERGGSLLALSEIALTRGDTALSRQLIESVGPVPPSRASRYLLLRTQIEIHDRNFDAARGYISKTSALPLSLAEWTKAELAKIDLAATRGRPRDAIAVVDAALRRISALASHTSNAVLRMLLQKRRLPLIAAGVRAILSVDPRLFASDGERVDVAWRWLGEVAAEAAPDEPSGLSSSRAFDEALAQVLLPTSGQGTTGPAASNEGQSAKKLLDLLSDRTKGTVHASVRSYLPLDGLHRTLAADQVVYAVIDTGERTACFWVGHGTTALAWIGPSAKLRDAKQRLMARIANPGSSLDSMREDIDELSTLLLGPLAGQRPRHLLVVADGSASDIPWSVLHWPDSNDALVTRTAVSWIRLGPAGSAVPAASKAVRVLVGASSEVPGAALGPLPTSRSESALIRESIPEETWSILPPVRATRESAFEALRSGDWVHFAAHGSAQPSYVGRSGIWVSKDGTYDEPELLTWVDVLARGVRASGVVLNACALGASPDAALSASVGFADATMRAGALDVVSALWPISDTATSLWVPTFYASLSRSGNIDGRLVAESLRHAAQKLYETRAFRHPSSWAALSHFHSFGVPTHMLMPLDRPAVTGRSKP